MKLYSVFLTFVLFIFLVGCSNETNTSNQTKINKTSEKVIYTSIKELNEIDGSWKNEFDKIIINSKSKTFQYNDGPKLRINYKYDSQIGFRILLYMGNTLTKDFVVNMNDEKNKWNI
ncbi:hypothetical protein PQG22_06380 [Aquirufa beregesia]